MEGKLKGMDKYKTIKTEQDCIERMNLIWIVCHIQDNRKKYVMTVVKN